MRFCVKCNCEEECKMQRPKTVNLNDPNVCECPKCDGSGLFNKFKGDHCKMCQGAGGITRNDWERFNKKWLEEAMENKEGKHSDAVIMEFSRQYEILKGFFEYGIKKGSGSALV